MELKISLESLKTIKPEEVKTTVVNGAVIDSISNEYTRIVRFKATESCNLEKWIDQNVDLVKKIFQQHRAVLFRGFSVDGSKGFESFTSRLSNSFLEYTEPSTPRSKISGFTYTSTEYPPDQFIPLHNEHSYSNKWPKKIWFYCDQPSEEGGETPIADSRAVLELIGKEVSDAIATKGLIYRRCFNENIDLSVRDFFQTTEKDAVEQKCRDLDMDFEWLEDGRLQTKKQGPVIFTHQETNEKVWFNQAHLFHISGQSVEIQKYLIDQLGIDHIPRNTVHLDGSNISDMHLSTIRNAYKKAQLAFKWERSDVLMLDNVLFAHGRNPFKGKRKIYVRMAEEESAPSVTSGRKDKSVQAARRTTADFYIRKLGEEDSVAVKRYKLAAVYRIMAMLGMDEGISGHISYRAPHTTDQFWVNPFGLLFEEVTPKNLITVDGIGTVLEGIFPVNVAGFATHSGILMARPDGLCICDRLARWATAFSMYGAEILPVDQNACMFFENHKVINNFDGPVNNVDNAQRIADVVKESDILIMKNHGALICGATCEAATVLAVALERALRLNVLAIQSGQYEVIAPKVARETRKWIFNDIASKIEFDALLRKVERFYNDFVKFRPTT